MVSVSARDGRAPITRAGQWQAARATYWTESGSASNSACGRGSVVPLGLLLMAPAQWAKTAKALSSGVCRAQEACSGERGGSGRSRGGVVVVVVIVGVACESTGTSSRSVCGARQVWMVVKQQ